MQLGELKENRPNYLLGQVSDRGESYGDKFAKFNSQIYQTFERIAPIRFAAKIPDRLRLPLAVLAAILFMKNHKVICEDYSALEFLDSCKSKLKEVGALAPQLNLENLLNLMRERIGVEGRLQRVVSAERSMSQAGELGQLMNAVAEVKGKEVENYSEEQMRKISTFFGERVFLINYDYNKGALTDRVLSHKYVYLLKAKDLYFVLFKEQDIEPVDRGVVSHEELAAVFRIENKLQKVQGKPAEAKSPSKGAKLGSTDVRSTSGQSDQAVLRLKQSTLFPDNVKCTSCEKVYSQFNAIFWNYSYFCVGCVMSPKVDISFIPTSIIEKFLKNQKIDTREYMLVCSECGSNTAIGNYRPWEKPKSYRCKACLKDICVEHQKMIGQCFCHCQACDKRTLTLAATFAKLCLTCRTRFCEVCREKGKVNCKCICKECGGNRTVAHEECRPRCHWCEAREVALSGCGCGRKLCGVCYFSSLQPNSSICGTHHPM